MNLRLSKVREILQKKKITAIIISNPINRNYISGFTGTEATLLIGLRRAYFITDFRYIEQAKQEISGFQIVEIKSGETALETCAQLIQQNRWLRVGFEAEHFTVATHQKLMKNIRTVRLIPTQRIVESLREIKDEHELRLIETSANIAEQAFRNVIPLIRIGTTEKEIAMRFEWEARKLGADKVAFELIVASGKRSALPHGVASDKKLRNGEFVTIDFGVVYQGYCSDCTRTFCIGKPTIKQKEIYEVVLKAQETALNAVCPQLQCNRLDSIARTVIEQAGYGKYFGHGLGHGVGREIHESPRLNKLNQTKLAPGMVITIEPGIYIPNWGGVRIEDLVVVTDKGYTLLTHYPKELISLPN
ncbi:MAG: Xaa-Pro peptidase family protein [bacterium]|nr:Xaa-Pro peptidase family protein [bacterium]